jgi:hypothetical protein
MVLRLLLSFCAILGFSPADPVRAQDLQSSIVGVWKLSSFTRTDPRSGEVTNVWGEQPVGYLVYTKAGRIITFLVSTDRKAPEKPDPTDSERAELFKSMIGYSGSYRVEGNKVIVRADASWIQSWTGIDRTQNADVRGDRLTITAIVKSPRDGSEVHVSNVWERVE